MVSPDFSNEQQGPTEYFPGLHLDHPWAKETLTTMPDMYQESQLNDQAGDLSKPSTPASSYVEQMRDILNEREQMMEMRTIETANSQSLFDGNGEPLSEAGNETSRSPHALFAIDRTNKGPGYSSALEASKWTLQNQYGNSGDPNNVTYSGPYFTSPIQQQRDNEYMQYTNWDNKASSTRRERTVDVTERGYYAKGMPLHWLTFLTCILLGLLLVIRKVLHSEMFNAEEDEPNNETVLRDPKVILKAAMASLLIAIVAAYLYKNEGADNVGPIFALLVSCCIFLAVTKLVPGTFMSFEGQSQSTIPEQDTEDSQKFIIFDHINPIGLGGALGLALGFAFFLAGARQESRDAKLPGLQSQVTVRPIRSVYRSYPQ